jgi:hypothetical protein
LEVVVFGNEFTGCLIVSAILYAIGLGIAYIYADGWPWYMWFVAGGAPVLLVVLLMVGIGIKERIEECFRVRCPACNQLHPRNKPCPWCVLKKKALERAPETVCYENVTSSHVMRMKAGAEKASPAGGKPKRAKEVDTPKKNVPRPVLVSEASIKSPTGRVERDLFDNKSFQKYLLVPICLIISFSVTAYTGYRLYKGHTSASWHETNGRIISAYPMLWWLSDSSYRVDLEYTYEIDSMLYTSGRITYGLKEFYPKQAIKDRYKTGSAVTVYYNPNKYSESALETGTRHWYDEWIIIIGFFAVGFVCSYSLLMYCLFHKKLDLGIFVVMPLVLIVIASLLVLCGYQFYMGLSSGSWPSTTGRIVNLNLSTPWWEEESVGYHLRAEYTYTVESEAYRSYRVSFGHRSYFSKKNASDQFPLGKEVEVYYDPENPANAVLEPGMKNLFSDWALIFVILALTIVALLVSIGYMIDPKGFMEKVKNK